MTKMFKVSLKTVAFVGGFSFLRQHGGLYDTGISHDYFSDQSGEDDDSQSRTDCLSINSGEADETQSKTDTNGDNSEFNNRSETADDEFEARIN